MVEPQGQVRQEQALMLEGEDPALCHPGCVHQPVSFLETPSHTLSTGITHPMWYRLPISGLGLRARTALVSEN